MLWALYDFADRVLSTLLHRQNLAREIENLLFALAMQAEKIDRREWNRRISALFDILIFWRN
jgi:hypothetical protein